MQHAYYSVISPEGCAGILWKSHEHAPKAAAALKFTSGHLKRLGIVDDVLEEPLGGAHRDHHQMATRMKDYLSRQLVQLEAMPIDELVEQRYEKYRRIGVFLESAKPVNSSANAAACEPNAVGHREACVARPTAFLGSRKQRPGRAGPGVAAELSGDNPAAHQRISTAP